MFIHLFSFLSDTSLIPFWHFINAWTTPRVASTWLRCWKPLTLFRPYDSLVDWTLTSISGLLELNPDTDWLRASTLLDDAPDLNCYAICSALNPHLTLDRTLISFWLIDALQSKPVRYYSISPASSSVPGSWSLGPAASFRSKSRMRRKLSIPVSFS